jgi:hypothetical protein
MKNPVEICHRFADRDMFMRYEWGLAVGHTYAHSDATAANEKVLADWRSVQTEQHPNPPSPEARNSSPEPTTVINQDSKNAVELEESVPSMALDAAGEGDDGESEEDHTCGDDEDYFSNPERDSEDEREALLFGWGSD